MFNTRYAHAVALFVSVLALIGTSSCGPRRVETVSGGEVTSPRVTSRAVGEVLASWPDKQRETADLLIAKYGEPTVVGDRMVAWFNAGPFVKTVLLRDGQPHNFPMPHVDYLTQTVRHAVPASKLAEL